MSFKTIMAIIGGDRAHDDVAAALQAAAEINAHLSVLLVGIAAPPTVGDYPVGTGWIERRDEDLKDLEATRKQTDSQCRASGVAYDITLAYSERASLEDMLFQKAIYCDLVMIGRSIVQAKGLEAAVVDAVVFEARRPLVVVPEDRHVTLKPKRILLAWDSKAEAAHAATAALDLLIQAEQVNLVVVDPDTLFWRNGEEPGADAALFLARHGVNVMVDQMASGGRAVEVVLQQHAVDLDAELMVMGAYGHSRMRQRIFGGVTTSILAQTRLPVLLAR